MRFIWAGKVLAVLGTIVVLGAVLARIGFLVDERQGYQAQAVESVQQSLAGAQTLLGPVLRRDCEETWTEWRGAGAERRQVEQKRDFALQLLPQRLEVDADSHSELRYRGIFKVNGFQSRLVLNARFERPGALQPKAEHADGQLSCKPLRLWLATSDVRGLRSADLVVDGRAVPVAPGIGRTSELRGLHADLEPAWTADARSQPPVLMATLTIDLVGTASLALVPAAANTQWTLRSDWPHPSFGGRFLPVSRTVRADGFEARWQLTALASAAGADLLAGKATCPGATGGNCLDTLAVDFVDPVNPYVLSDRAVKYGLLFVVLTFVAVALAEALARGRVRRVHPVQYGLVGLTLCLFFLLLLSLSEHLAFGLAYALAATACVPLLAVYARHMLGRVRDGLAFGAGMALLYGLLYLLLQREQTALLIGSLGLFASVAAVMLLTRRTDWYALG